MNLLHCIAKTCVTELFIDPALFIYSVHALYCVHACMHACTSVCNIQDQYVVRNYTVLYIHWYEWIMYNILSV